jgi:hypothetical protein
MPKIEFGWGYPSPPGFWKYDIFIGLADRSASLADTQNPPPEEFAVYPIRSA